MSSLEADKLFKEANKLSTPSPWLLRFHGDWMSATPLFERAAQMYKQTGNLGAAKACYEKAAIGQERQKSPWHAAKNMERAGDLAKETGDWESVSECYGRAAELFAEEGRLTNAAEAMARGARALEERRPEEATKMYNQAVEWMQESGKDAMAGDVFRQATAHLIRQKRWADATALLMKHALSCEAAGAHSSQCKAYLSAVIVWLFAGDAGRAWETYQDALAVDVFSSSDEAFAAEEVIEAYRSGDGAQVAAAVKRSPLFTHLDNQVARLAKQLPQGDVAAMAAKLGGAAPAAGSAEAEEEDLT